MERIPFTQIRRAYEEANPDGSWFSPQNMEFFGTKLPGYGYKTAAGIFFVTSEKNPSGVVRYSVRKLTGGVKIKTVGEFHSINGMRAATSAIRRLHEEALAVEA